MEKYETVHLSEQRISMCHLLYLQDVTQTLDDKKPYTTWLARQLLAAFAKHEACALCMAPDYKCWLAHRLTL